MKTEMHRHDASSKRRLRGSLCAGLLALIVINGPVAPGEQPGMIDSQSSESHVASYEAMHQVHRTVDTEIASPESVSFDAGWWSKLVSRPIRDDSPQLNLSLEATLVRALDSSKQIKVFSELPLIRETAVIEANAAFDWTAYMNGRWDDQTNPIGNSLTAGAGVRYYEDEHLSGRAGFRRRTRSGAQVDVNQQLGHQRTNSTFFVPNPQGTSRLNLSFTQPLRRGRGTVYNTSLVMLAEIDHKVSEDEFNRQLQSHLLEVARSYWSLYLERAVLYQKINSYIRGKTVFDRLNSRREIDASASQIVSAEAALKQRISELVRARAAVKNAESRLRSLVNDAQMMENELIPVDKPSFESFPVFMDESLSVAFQMRPELHQAIKNIKAASVRLNMAKHELMPVLNLVADAYMSGLAAEGDVGKAFGNEFSSGRPSYGIGLEYELPICNRAANARHRRRQLEIRQLRNQYSTTLETVRLEVEVAVREFQTSQTELVTKLKAMNARSAQLDALTLRWEQLPGQDVTASLALENLLLAQDRLAQSEYDYLQAQLTFKLSIFNVKRATGTLLKSENINIGRAQSCGLPEQIVDKGSIVVPALDIESESSPVTEPADMPSQAARAMPVPPPTRAPQAAPVPPSEPSTTQPVVVEPLPDPLSKGFE